jgi:short-subunit dehydrogenase
MRNPRGILITGASGGIGAALALACAAPGRALFLQGRNESRLRELAAACSDQGSRVETRVLDLADIAALIAWVEQLAPRVDLGIVNAGVTSNVRVGEGWNEIDRVLQVNVRAALATAATLAGAMRARGAGQIALVSSIAAWFGLPLTPAYSASKAAVKAYGEALRGGLASAGVEVSVVMPGFVRTPMAAQFPGPKRFMLSPEDAARRILRGLERNQARIAFPFASSFAMWALGALPASLSQRLLASLGYGR